MVYNVIEKQCSKCGLIKSIDEFYINRRHKDGRCGRCKTCIETYNKKYRKARYESIKAYKKGYYLKHPEAVKKDYQKQKLRAFQKVSGLEKPICSSCGCDDLRLLQVNHINGGGYREYKLTGASGGQLYRRILNGSKKINDLNILCRPCDALYYLQKKYGDIPMKIVWRGNNNDI